MGLEATFTDEEVRQAQHFNRKRAAIAVGTGVTTSLATYILFPPSLLVNQPWPSLGWGLAAYSFLEINLSQIYNLFTMFTHRGLRFTGHALALPFHKLQSGTLEEKTKRRKQKEIQLLDDMIPAIKDPLFQRRFSIYRDLAAKNYEDALRKAVAFMHFEDAVRPWPSPLQKILLNGTALLNTLVGGNKEASSHLSHALECLGRGDRTLADLAFTKACTLDSPQQIQVNCAYSYFLELRSQHKQQLKEKAHQQWRKTLELVLADSALTQQFQRLGKSKNEVLIIRGEGILQNSFVFKRSHEQEHLQREYTLTSKLSEIFDGKDTVAQALAFLSHEGHHYCVLKRIAGDSVKKYLTTANRQEVLARVLPFITQFHQRLLERRDHFPAALIKTRDYGNYLTQTYAPRMHLPETAGVSKAIGYVAQQLDSQRQQLIHGDLHPENILVSKTGLTIIDPETLALASPYLDVAAFLEHDVLAVSSAEREQSLHTYHGTLDNHTFSSEQTSLDYFHGALFRMLYVRAAYEKQSYGLSAEDWQRRKEYYTQRAFILMQQLRAIDNNIGDQGLEYLLLTH